MQENIVTIAIPTYERAEMLEESLRSALNQDFSSDWKVLVCDNGAEDLMEVGSESLRRLLGSSRVRYIHNERNLGMFGNWNKCLYECETGYITILNDDDLLESNFLAEIDALRLKRPGGLAYLAASATFGNDEFLRAAHSGLELWVRRFLRRVKELLSPSNRSEIRVLTDTDLFYGNPTNGGLGVTFQVETAREIGGYRSSAGGGADWDLLVRLSQVGKLYLSKKIVGRYRYEVNTTLNEGVMESFLKTAPIIRAELVNSEASMLRKMLFRWADSLQNTLQAKRYELITQNANMIVIKKNKIYLFSLFTIFLMRAYLRCIVVVLSHVR